MNQVRKSLYLSFAENYTGFIINIISTLIIARLLTPKEIGIFSVGAVLIGMAHIVRDFGVSQYIVREKNLTTEKIRAAFALTLAIGWFLAGILFLISNPVAELYNEPGLQQVIILLAINFLLIPFGSITLAFLRRKMDFYSIYWIKTTSAFAQFLTSVLLAFSGYGFLSLAWGAIAGVITTILMTNWYRPKELPWLPSFREISKVLSFGGYVSGVSVVGEISNSAPDLIIGKVLSMEAVGIFGKAMGLIHIFNRLVMNAIRPVSYPLFSNVVHSGHDIKIAYLQATNYITAISWPFFSFLGLMAYPIIRILYGSQWDACVPIVRILCLSAALASIFGFAGELFVAMGQVKKQLQLQLSIQPIRIGAILVAAPFGLEAISIALVVAFFINSIIYFRFLNSFVSIELMDLMGAVYKSFGIMLLTMLTPLVVLFYMQIDHEHLWLPLLVATTGASVGWLCGVIILDHPIKNELTGVLIKSSSLLRLKLVRS